jgi:hypothetical protein
MAAFLRAAARKASFLRHSPSRCAWFRVVSSQSGGGENEFDWAKTPSDPSILFVFRSM